MKRSYSIAIDCLSAIVCIVIAFILQIPHLISNFGDPNFDFYLHYNWAKEFSENISLGELYPRWVYHARYNLGEPVFLFYSPFYFYLVAIVSNIGLSIWHSMQLVEIAMDAIFGWFVYKISSYYTNTKIAIFIAIASILNPFLVMLHYKWQGFPWASVGFASLGFLFWSLMRPDATKKFVNVPAIIALAFAIISHIVSAFISIIVFTFLAIFRTYRESKKRERISLTVLNSWIVTVLAASGLSAFYLFPALFFKNLLNTQAWINPMLQGFAVPLITMKKYGMQWFFIQWPLSLFAFGIFGLATIYFILFNNKRSTKHAGPWQEVLLIGAFAVFFSSELSYPFWILKTPLQQIVVPYRFLFLVYLFGIFAVGLMLANSIRLDQKLWIYLANACLVAIILTGISLSIEANYVSGYRLPQSIDNNDYTFGAYREEFFKGDLSCKHMNHIDCMQFRRSAGPFLGVGEYRLPWSKKDYEEYAAGGIARECNRLGLKCSTTRRIRGGLEWTIQAMKPTFIRLPLFHFPSWQIFMDEKPVTHEIDVATGLIKIRISNGIHRVRAVWHRSIVEKLSLYVSLVTLIGLLCYRFLYARWSKYSGKFMSKKRSE